MVELPEGALDVCRKIVRPRGSSTELREAASSAARVELQALFEQRAAARAAQGAVLSAQPRPEELVEMALCHHKWAEAFATWQGEAAEKERRARRAAEAKEVVSWWDGSGDAVRLVGDDEATRSPRRGFGGDLDRSSASVAALAPAPPGYMRTTDSRRHQTGRRQSVYSPTKRAPRTPAVPRVDAGWSRRLEAAELGARPQSEDQKKAKDDLAFRLRESRLGTRAARSAYAATKVEHTRIFPNTGNWR